jgi:hypothetical protein
VDEVGKSPYDHRPQGVGHRYEGLQAPEGKKRVLFLTGEW